MSVVVVLVVAGSRETTLQSLPFFSPSSCPRPTTALLRPAASRRNAVAAAAALSTLPPFEDVVAAVPPPTPASLIESRGRGAPGECLPCASVRQSVCLFVCLSVSSKNFTLTPAGLHPHHHHHHHLVIAPAGQHHPSRGPSLPHSATVDKRASFFPWPPLRSATTSPAAGRRTFACRGTFHRAWRRGFFTVRRRSLSIHAARPPGGAAALPETEAESPRARRPPKQRRGRRRVAAKRSLLRAMNLSSSAVDVWTRVGLKSLPLSSRGGSGPMSEPQPQESSIHSSAASSSSAVLLLPPRFPPLDCSPLPRRRWVAADLCVLPLHRTIVEPPSGHPISFLFPPASPPPLPPPSLRLQGGKSSWSLSPPLPGKFRLFVIGTTDFMAIAAADLLPPPRTHSKVAAAA